MPELPEVETVANGVHARVAGQRIESVWTSGKPQTFKTPEAEIVEALTGARIVRVRRVGKTVVVDLTRGAGMEAQIALGNDNQKSQGKTQIPFPPHRAEALGGDPAGNDRKKSKGEGEMQVPFGVDTQKGGFVQLLVHLGMTGRLLVSQPEVPWPAHTHAVLVLSDGRELRFVDPRRFGRLSLVHSTAAAAGGYNGPGAEPTTISPDAFAGLFRGRKLAIKAALLNQSLVHGVGNIYADESLFRAGIRPRKAAGRLTRAELGRLHAALQAVLARAIALGGSSVSDYVDAAGVRGFFQIEHKVYGRAGQACLDCARALKKIVVGGRTTIYCSKCQR